MKDYQPLMLCVKTYEELDIVCTSNIPTVFEETEEDFFFDSQGG